MDIGKLREELEAAFDKTVVSFGQTPKNSTIPFTFNYNGEHKIESVKGTCSCTDLKVNGNVITGVVRVGEGDKHGVKSTDITVYFFPEEPDYLINNGIRDVNPKKITINLRVTGKVI